MNFYYHPNPEESPFLSNEESAHLIKVFRARIGDEIMILDGKGHRYLAAVTDPNPRKCEFRIIEKKDSKPKEFRSHIAIAPTKNIDRLEWFIEKACEMGIDEISLILTQRSERKKVNIERLEKKAISAMKQSKNLWKCQINPLLGLREFLSTNSDSYVKIAAYVETGKEDLLQKKIKPQTDTLILIGPEGDFSPTEIEDFKQAGFQLASLGQHILRTETAGLAAVHTINLINQGI